MDSGLAPSGAPRNDDRIESRMTTPAAGLTPRPGCIFAPPHDRNAAGTVAAAPPLGVGPGSAAKKGFRADERRRHRASDPGDRGDEIAAGLVAHPQAAA